MNREEIENYRKAGIIARQVKEYAKSIIKQGMKLLEIAEKIEEKIRELGGKPAFPVNLSINETAAHYTPNYDDETKAEGLLKVDIGVQVNGHIADTAFSLDLENTEENKILIEAAERALEEAIKISKQEVEVWKIGRAIQDTISKFNLVPIRNLSGHELGRNHVHAGLTIPNVNNSSPKFLEKKAYAIEPFATSGSGEVYDGKLSGIYRLEEKKPVRDLLARQILAFIEQEYETLPFCERWIVNKFGSRAILSLRFLEQAGIIHQYSQLVEKSHKKVSQAEHTILITDKTEVTT